MPLIPTIVYVEDNAGDVLLLKQAFEQRLVQVELQVIPNGEQALRYLRVKESAKDAPPPDLLLFDLHLPKVDGDALVAHVQSSPYLKGIPWFIFAEPRGESRGRFANIPEDRCVAKPTEWDAYLILVDRFIAAITRHRRKVS